MDALPGSRLHLGRLEEANQLDQRHLRHRSRTRPTVFRLAARLDGAARRPSWSAPHEMAPNKMSPPMLLSVHVKKKSPPCFCKAKQPANCPGVRHHGAHRRIHLNHIYAGWESPRGPRPSWRSPKETCGKAHGLRRRTYGSRRGRRTHLRPAMSWTTAFLFHATRRAPGRCAGRRDNRRCALEIARSISAGRLSSPTTNPPKSPAPHRFVLPPQCLPGPAPGAQRSALGSNAGLNRLAAAGRPPPSQWPVPDFALNLLLGIKCSFWRWF
jgi:hypothetical protein